jgi:peptide/nickel transport system permease protein
MLRPGLTRRLEGSAGARLGAIRDLPIASKIVLTFLLLLGLVAVFAPLVATQSPLATGTPVQPPSGAHWFGTDAIGRDIFSRVVHGARTSLLIGLFAATAGKVVSEVLMRILDIVMSFPGIALAAVFVAVFGNSVPVLIGTIGFLYVPQLSRVIRANVLAQFGEDYVAASRVMGARTPWILVKHVARNCLAPIMVFATVLVADAIVFEASLSFINAGVKPPDPSWGNILADGKQVLLSGYWWPTFFPGLMILLTVLCLNVLSEGLTDTLASPRAKVRADVEADEAQVETAQRALGGATASGTAYVTPTTENAVAYPSERGEHDASVLDEAVAGGLLDPQAGKVLGKVDPLEAERLLAANLATLAVKERDLDRRLVFTGDAAPLLEVKDLSIGFPSAHGDVDIVDKVSFDVRPNETMGLVGESGCGKSITTLAIMGLLPPTARVTGSIRFDGRELLTMSAKERNALRGHDMAMIYQDALSSLNPSMLIKSQLEQLIHRGGKRTAADLLELVGLDPQRTLKSYPHELSGGQRQRVLIAMALTRNPRLVIADEPTTALDVTVQQQVVDLLNDLRSEIGFATVFVSHDLALVAQLAHRITVMYAGQVVEQGDTKDLLVDPRHEYTRGLLGAVLSIETRATRLHQVQGTVPSPRDFVVGDRFAPRSVHRDIGSEERPTLRTVPGTTHRYAATQALETALAAASAGPEGGNR